MSVAPETPRPRKTPQQSGNYRFFYVTDDSWARQQKAPMVSSCFFCGAEAPAGSTVEEGMAWFAAHRKAKHPRAKDRGQWVRNRAAKAAQGQRW